MCSDVLCDSSYCRTWSRFGPTCRISTRRAKVGLLLKTSGMKQLLTNTIPSHQQIEPRIIPRPLSEFPAKTPLSTTSVIAACPNSYQRSGHGVTAVGSDAVARVDEAVTDADDSEEEKHLARSVISCLSEHDFQPSLPSPRTSISIRNIRLLT